MLCIPSTNRASFVKSLAPYLKKAEEGQTEDEKRAWTQILLCLLSILSALLLKLKGSGLPMAIEIEADLINLIKSHKFIAVRISPFTDSFLCLLFSPLCPTVFLFKGLVISGFCHEAAAVSKSVR